MAQVVYEAEIERLVGITTVAANMARCMRWTGKHCAACAKRMRRAETICLSVYDVEQAKVMSQVEVGRKENEITKAPQALKIG